MGQILCVFMIGVGIGLFVYLRGGFSSSPR